MRVAAALRCRRCNEVHYLNDDQLCLDCSDKQEASVPKPKPIYALPREERREAAQAFAGDICTIDIRPMRNDDDDLNYTVRGRVIGVATPNAGTVADQLIVQTPRSLLALSLATVRSIEVA